MAYSSLISNEFVSNSNLQDAVTTSVLTLKTGQTIPVDNRILNKQDVLNYVNIDSNNTYLTTKTSVQLISKRDITPISGGNYRNVLIIVTPSFGTTTPRGSFDNVIGIEGYTQGTAVNSTNSPVTGLHIASSSALSIAVSGNKSMDGVDIYVNGIFIERIITNSQGTYTTGLYTLSSSDAIEFNCNNNNI